MMYSKQFVFVVILDVLIVILALIPSIILENYDIGPVHRGLFCTDESIRYPYYGSTVPYTLVVFIGLGLPIIAIITLELSIARMFKRASIDVRFACLSQLLALFLGASLTQGVTDILKVAVGRLRPHFLSVCMSDACPPGVIPQPIYIENITCTSNDTDLLRQARLSFPSGHTSLAAYCMVYFALYLQVRWIWHMLQPVKLFLQSVSVTMAMYVASSRVADNKHHTSDVFAGFILGGILAFAAVTLNMAHEKRRQAAAESKCVTDTVVWCGCKHMVVTGTNSAADSQKPLEHDEDL